MQRFSFHSRMRTANETVIEYVAALRRIAADCNFGNQLDENLRDRLLCGVNDCAIQRRLLSESHRRLAGLLDGPDLCRRMMIACCQVEGMLLFSPLHPYTHRTQRLVWVPWCDSRNRAFQYQIEAASWQRTADRMRAE